ncbi:MAG: Na/Pi cotransporter family protein [Candidatus Enteromonas sp.]|nr:Na/Pi cotransporter family protein [Candidatus Enteromonas sp.]
MKSLLPNNPLFWFLVLAGLGLFLFGITSISRVIKKMADSGLQKIMNKCSGNRFSGFLTGALFTAVIQSSGGTTALTIGMVRAGVLTFLAAAPIIIGANVGTTITSFIISIPVAEYLSICVFLGGFILLLATRRKWQNIGDLLFAIGCIFLGLWIMASNLKELAAYDEFRAIMTFLTQNPWLGLLVGMVLTAALQSSSAVIGVVQSLYTASIAAAVAASGASEISLFGILPILFGANIGTTITALISSIGGSKDSKRAAVFHLVYNASGALLFMGIIFIPPIHTWLASSGTWALSPSFQIAFSHLFFNVVTAFIFLAILKPVCALVEKIIPGSDRVGPSIVIRELDSKVMASFPSEGIALGKEQVVSMFEYGKLMFETIKDYLEKKKPADAEFVHDIESSIDKIDRQMNDYLLVADKGDMTAADVTLLTRTLRACKDIERIGDYGENLITFYENIVERKDAVPEKTKQIIIQANLDAIDLISQTLQAFKEDNRTLSLSIIKRRRVLVEHLEEIITEFINEMPSGKDASRSYVELIFVDIMNSYQRIYSHCSNIAKLYGTDKQYNFKDETRLENITYRY